MEVYGPQPKHTVCDHLTTPYPNAPYAVAKYGVEKYLEYAGRSYSLPYTIIRQTNCYGRKDNDFFVTEQIITQMLNNPDEIHLGYAEPYRNFIYIDDMLEAWTAIINNPEKCKEKIFTLGPDNPIQIKDYVDIIAQKADMICAVEVKTRSTPEFGNPQDFVKPKQIQQLVKAMDFYLIEHDLDVELRFDIVAIIKNKLGTRIEHLEDAFLYF